MMRKITLIITILLFTGINNNAFSQDHYISSGCYQDDYQFSSNHQRYYYYGRLDVGLPSNFEENHKAYPSTFSSLFPTVVHLRRFPLNDSFDNESCPDDDDHNTVNDTYPPADLVSLGADLYKNGVFISTIVSQYTFTPSVSIISQFRDQVENWDIPDNLENGKGYTIRFHLEHSRHPTYYDSFDVSATFESESFVYGDASIFTFPTQNQEVSDLSPLFTWEERNNAQYKVVLGLASNPPTFNFNENTGIYTISNAIYESTYTTDLQFQWPNSQGDLQVDTEYIVNLISSFDGVEYRSERQFSTRGNIADFNALEFYNQGVTANSDNPNNYLQKGVPVRFKIQVENELSQNLSTLQATISSSTTGVTITDDSANFDTVTSGALAWSTDEFEIIVGPSVADGTNIEFELSLNDDFVSGGPWISHFSFPIAPFSNGTILLSDSSGGNGDDIPEPGESDIKIFPKINNNSNYTLAEVRGILSSEDQFLSITSENQRYNVLSNVFTPINPNENEVDPELPFEFDYPSNQPLQELNFNLELQARLDDVNGTLIKSHTHFLYNEGIEPSPFITSTSPTDDAVNVAIETNLVITFDKNINAVSGKNIEIYKDVNLDRTVEVTDSQVSISNNEVVLDVTTNLDGGSNYYVLIDEGAFVDDNSNPFEGISQSTFWNFSTVQTSLPNTPSISLEVLSDSEIQVNWDAVDDTDFYQVLSCDENTVYANSITSTNFIVNGLNPDTAYDFIVKAINQAGASNPSNCEQASTFCSVSWGSIQTYGNQLITAYGIVTINGESVTEQDKVGVFSGNELRSVGDIVISDNVAYTTLLIENDGTETFSFKVWDQSECEEVDVEFTVEAGAGDTLGFPPDYLPIDAIHNSLSTEDIHNIGNEILIYPNPSDQFVSVKSSENIIIQKIKIFDSRGKLIRVFDKNLDHVSIRNFSSGLYFFKITTDKGSIIKKVLRI